METNQKKLAGLCLLIGALMAVLTMVLHPMGGSLEHIVKIKGVLMFSHSMAIACMPFIAFGLWGFTKTLKTRNGIAILGFFIAMFGLAAATLAGILNGLVLPQFASYHLNKGIDLAYLQPIMDYGRFFNKSLAYIFMIAITIAILIWSVVIIQQGKFSKWLGYYGLIVFVVGILALLSKSNMVSVALFGVFVFVMASWLFITGIMLYIHKEK